MGKEIFEKNCGGKNKKMELYTPLAVCSHIEKYQLKKNRSKILNGQLGFCNKKQRKKVEILGYLFIRK